MTNLIWNRIKTLIPMIILVSILSFSLLELAPGDPADAYITPLMTTEDITKIKENMGLDKPFYVRYANWGMNVLKGDFGVSYINHMPVGPQIYEKFMNTMVLVGTSLVISLIIALILGTLSAVKENSLLDRLVELFNQIGISIPSFWIGMLLIAIFSVKLNLFPTGGMHNIGDDSLKDLIKHLILPLITISLYNISIFTRYVKTSVSQELKKQYVITAKAKGLSSTSIFFKHILKNALTSVATILGMSIQRLVTGAFVTEVVFAWPGMGRLMIDSIFSRDYSMIMAITLLSAVFLILGNLLADILYIVLDPKLRKIKGGA